MIVIDLDECGVCEKCIPVCPKDLIEKKGYTMVIKDGCDDCGICMDMCPLGAIYEE
ncbi:4Fe-4S binding protein [uncultured Methanobrevibacter sp.]|uniref:4Fe-4S binding protein n=1 Tax=Methanobrevibacter sp. TaxID=66852 RepID=UPI003743FADA|nr:4Fe-4S binding protein [archaeon]